MPKAAWPTGGSGLLRGGADQRSAPSPPSAPIQPDGRLRSGETARSTPGSWRRSTCRSTTERAAASELRWHGDAAGQEIDDPRLRLPVAVEPVVGDHSPAKHDGDPEGERNPTSPPHRLGRHAVSVPAGDLRIDARVKDPCIQGRYDQQDHFTAEEEVL